jgi:transposase-like protein/DNA-directed RNA polymerase subunit RPC12/RpoP
MEKCIYCGHYILYKLSDGNLKCAKCKRKFSPKKIKRKEIILKLFLQNLTPTKIAKISNISYATVVKEIKNIRINMAQICEDKFLEKNQISEFEEYLYIPNKDIYKAENFLTIDYGHIYNILLSDMKNYENLSQKEIKSMFLQRRIIKYQNHIKIQQFWDYFEEFMKKFRGVNKHNFFYYLKEAEFRFNNFCI